MYRTAIAQEILERRVLHSVMLELTYRCNWDCFFCYNIKDADGTPLRLSQYLTLFDDLAAMQTLFLTFTGGEPMVHPRFFDLGAAAYERGFAVRIRTNGYTLTPKVARRVKREIDPYSIEMSLHGATAQSHDRQTRVPGSFQQMVANIRGMNELGIRQSLVCTPTAWNEHELEAMWELADELGVPLRWQGPVAPRDDGDTEPLKIQPSSEAWQELNRLNAQRRAAGADDSVMAPPADDLDGQMGRNQERVCSIGTTGVDIDPFGNVYPCMHLRRPVGSLHEQSISDIWNGVQGRRRLALAEKLSINAARRFEGKPLEQFGAPLFCPAVEVNSSKGCGSGGCAGGGCGSS